MLVYLRIDVLDMCDRYTAFHRIEDSPSYIWRHSNYQEGMNYLRTHVYRSLLKNSGPSMGLAVF